MEAPKNLLCLFMFICRLQFRDNWWFMLVMDLLYAIYSLLRIVRIKFEATSLLSNLVGSYAGRIHALGSILELLV